MDSSRRLRQAAGGNGGCGRHGRPNLHDRRGVLGWDGSPHEPGGLRPGLRHLDTAGRPAAAPLAAGRGARPDGRIYVFGGYSADAVWQRAVLRYDTSADTWETLASTPPLRPETALTGLDGRIYVIANTSDS